MNKNPSIILAGLLGISLLIPGGILSTASAQTEYSDNYGYGYEDNKYSDSYGYEEKDKKSSDSYAYEEKDKKSSDPYGYEVKDDKYSNSYGYEVKDDKYSNSYGYEVKDDQYSNSYGYEVKDDKKDKENLIIKKVLFQCLNPSETNNGQFELCGDEINENSRLVNCNLDREDICLDIIRNSDFQIDVIPAVQGSKHPINFDIDQTKFKVDEQFRLNDIGDALCFLANDIANVHFNDGGIYETADERHFFVCADYVGDCDVNQEDDFVKDDKGREMSYKDYDNGYKDADYKIPSKCTVNNYVFAELDELNADILTQLLQNRAALS